MSTNNNNDFNGYNGNHNGYHPSNNGHNHNNNGFSQNGHNAGITTNFEYGQLPANNYSAAQILTTLDANTIAKVLQVTQLKEETVKKIMAKREELAQWEKNGKDLQTELEGLNSQLARFYTQLNALVRGEVVVEVPLPTNQSQSVANFNNTLPTYNNTAVSNSNNPVNSTNPNPPTGTNFDSVLEEARKHLQQPWLES